MIESDVNLSLLNKRLVGVVKAIVPPGTKMANGTITTVVKLQVFLAPMHQGVPDNQLPYFAIMRPLFRGASAGVGMFEIPRIGSKVVVIFDNNDEKSGIVIGELLDGSVLPGDAFSNSYGWQDEFGNIYQVNLETGAITLTAGSAQSITVIAGATKLIIDNNNGVTITGNVSIDGDLLVTGATNTEDTITSTAEITGNGIPLSTHNHAQPPGGTGNYNAPPNGGPVTGASGKPLA